MPREPRKEYAGAIHHVIVRGVNRTVVAVDSLDYAHTLVLLERVVARFELRCHAWCLLPNHSHFLVTSQLGNISGAMHWFGTCYAQSFNRRYERSGHLYQGRFRSQVVADDAYLLELARYLPLNPVKAGLCDSPADWKWSSYSATAGLVSAPPFLDTSTLFSFLGSSDAYVNWVTDGILATWLDEDGRPQPPPRPSLESLLTSDSDQAIAGAYFRHGYSQVSIAKHLGVSRAQIGRRLAR